MTLQSQSLYGHAVAAVGPAPIEDTLTKRSDAAYLDTVDRTFEFLKSTSRYDELILRGIPLDGGGRLVPLCKLHIDDEALICQLAAWREQNFDAFPTQFKVTPHGTSRWLCQGVLDNPGRLTFLILNRVGRPIGHLGLANADSVDRNIEIDNVVRGENGIDPGLMAEALRTLIQWTYDHLTPANLTLRVFEDNVHAVRFYSRCGFVVQGRIPLTKISSEDTIRFEPTNDLAQEARAFLVMKHVPDVSHVGETTILTAGPSISAREISYVHDATRSGWNGEWNKYITAFERSFAHYVGRRFAIATSSCTGALHMAVLAAGIGPGDEVIVPEITWVATANAVMYAGATPVFCDVDPQTWCLDPESFASKITPRTKAVIPVHLYGHPAAMHRILPIAEAHGISVIEDAAPSIGAECLGQRTGSFGDSACFSFQGAKLLVTGEGGMFVTDDPTLYERAKTIADQGRDPRRTFWIQELGWKYKISNIQAALGLGQLERAEELVERKRRIFDWYAEDLASIPGIEICSEADYARSIYWMTSIRVTDEAPINRDGLAAALKRRNIDTRPVFPAISQYPYWPSATRPQPIAHRVGDTGLNLPSGVLLTRDEVRYVGNQIQMLMNRYGRAAA